MTSAAWDGADAVHRTQQASSSLLPYTRSTRTTSTIRHGRRRNVAAFHLSHIRRFFRVSFRCRRGSILRMSPDTPGLHDCMGRLRQSRKSDRVECWRASRNAFLERRIVQSGQQRQTNPRCGVRFRYSVPAPTDGPGRRARGRQRAHAQRQRRARGDLPGGGPRLADPIRYHGHRLFHEIANLILDPSGRPDNFRHVHETVEDRVGDRRVIDEVMPPCRREAGLVTTIERTPCRPSKPQAGSCRFSAVKAASPSRPLPPPRSRRATPTAAVGGRDRYGLSSRATHTYGPPTARYALAEPLPRRRYRAG